MPNRSSELSDLHRGFVGMKMEHVPGIERIKVLETEMEALRSAVMELMDTCDLQSKTIQAMQTRLNNLEGD